eukprot:scaffold437_cov288-Chaetoceros_neogracile.AAC.27
MKKVGYAVGSRLSTTIPGGLHPGMHPGMQPGMQPGMHPGINGASFTNGMIEINYGYDFPGGMRPAPL